MLLRDFLNEFELDWAQAACRSAQIPLKKIKKKKKYLLVGEQEALQDAAAWSFMAWNDEAKARDPCRGSLFKTRRVLWKCAMFLRKKDSR